MGPGRPDPAAQCGSTVGGLLLSVIGHFRTAGGSEPDAVAAHEDDPEPVAVPA